MANPESLRMSEEQLSQPENNEYPKFDAELAQRSRDLEKRSRDLENLNNELKESDEKASKEIVNILSKNKEVLESPSLQSVVENPAFVDSIDHYLEISLQGFCKNEYFRPLAEITDRGVNIHAHELSQEYRTARDSRFNIETDLSSNSVLLTTAYAQRVRNYDHASHSDENRIENVATVVKFSSGEDGGIVIHEECGMSDSTETTRHGVEPRKSDGKRIAIDVLETGSLSEKTSHRDSSGREMERSRVIYKGDSIKVPIDSDREKESTPVAYAMNHYLRGTYYDSYNDIAAVNNLMLLKFDRNSVFESVHEKRNEDDTVNVSYFRFGDVSFEVDNMPQKNDLKNPPLEIRLDNTEFQAARDLARKTGQGHISYEDVLKEYSK